MARRDNRRSRSQGSTEPAQDDGETDSVFDRGTSLQDLSTPAEPTQFDQTFQVDSNDISVSPDGNIPIAKPWQGIPRAAVVFNLNYIYDADRGEWIRQKKSDLIEEDVVQDGDGDAVFKGVHIATSPDRNPTRIRPDSVDTVIDIPGSKARAVL